MQLDLFAAPVAFEMGNRRAEVAGDVVRLFRLTGNVRRSKRGWWFGSAGDPLLAEEVARRWVCKGKLDARVLH
jgi:hypothetical protein